MTLAHLIATRAGDWTRRHYVETTPLGTLWRELEAHFRPHAHDWGFEGFSRAYAWTTSRSPELYLADDSTLEAIRHSWIVVFPVTGANEGHYVHVELATRPEGVSKLTPLFLTKTFQGQEAAIQIAAELARVLGV